MIIQDKLFAVLEGAKPEEKPEEKTTE
jgi:hypothetical protein